MSASLKFELQGHTDCPSSASAGRGENPANILTERA